MYKYDIPYPAPDQFALLFREIPINCSKRKSYLIAKMKAHRDMMCDDSFSEIAEYTIVDSRNNIIYKKTYQAGERGNSKAPYFTEKAQENDIKYVQQDRFSLIADSTGKILTDTELLDFLDLVRFRFLIPMMITNRMLVSMATYKPKTEAEFVELKYLGQKTYDVCGELFINAITAFENEHKQDEGKHEQ